MPIDSLAVALRFLQALAVLLLMLVSALLAAVAAPKIEFHGPLFTSWIIAELLSLAILVVLFVESIFAFAYDLQPRGSVNFQGVKTGMWVLVMLVGIVGLVATGPRLHERFVGGWVAALGVVLLLFLAGLGHAIWVYRGGSGGAAAGLRVVFGGQEGVDRERAPLLAQQRPEEGD